MSTAWPITRFYPPLVYTLLPPIPATNLTSPIAPPYHVYHEPILISLLYYVYCFAVCESGRQLAMRCITVDTELRTMCIEFCGTLQICVMLFEAQPIFLTYGINVFTMSLFGLVLLHCYTLRGAFVDPSSLIYLRTIHWFGMFSIE